MNTPTSNTAPRPSRECRVAIIGAGAMAREHAKAFADVPSVTLAGIFSRTKEKAEALAHDFHMPVVAASVSELYARTRADLVVVCVSLLHMKDVVVACLEHPWTVLMEKPVGLDLEEAAIIRQQASRRGRTVLVGLNRRFMSSTQAVRADLVASGGRRLVVVQDQEDLVEARQYGHPAEVLTHWMYANSIHVIDYLPVLAGGRAVAVERVVPWTPASPGIVVARIDFENGAVGLYEGLWNRPGPWAVSVSTPEKRWEIRPLEMAKYQPAGTRKQIEVPVHDWDRNFKPGFRLQAEQAVAEALGDRSESVGLESAIATMELIRDIYATE